MIIIVYLFTIIHIVITVVSRSNFENCVEYYVAKKLVKKRFFFLILNYNYYQFIDFDLSSIAGSFLSLSYHQNSTFFRNYAFKQRATTLLDSSAYISPYYENCYSSINIFKLAVEKALEYDVGSELPGSDYVRLTIPNIQYQSPSGVITMTVNNYADRPMFLMEINGNNNFLQVNPEIGKSRSYKPYPFIVNLPKEYENIRSIEIIKRSKAINWFVFSLCLVNIVVLLLCLIYTIRFRNNRIIKCSSATYYYCLIFSLIIASISVVYLTSAPKVSSVVCYMRINSCLLSVILFSSLLFVKAAKFNFSRKKRIHKVYILLFCIHFTRSKLHYSIS